MFRPQLSTAPLNAQCPPLDLVTFIQAAYLPVRVCVQADDIAADIVCSGYALAERFQSTWGGVRHGMHMVSRPVTLCWLPALSDRPAGQSICLLQASWQTGLLILCS